MNQLRADTTENKVSALLLLLFAASLPFDRFYSQLLLIFLFLHVLIQLRSERLRQLPFAPLLLQSSVWLLTFAGTAFSAFAPQAFPFWERQLSIFLIPFCLYLLPIDLQRYRKVLLQLFLTVNCAVALYLFSDALRTMLYYHQPLAMLWSPAYLSHNFSEPLDLHATYLSLFMALSLCFSIQQLLEGSVSKLQRALHIFASLLLTLALLQLASRAVLAGTALIAITLLPFSTGVKKRRNAWWLLLALGAVLGYVLLRSIPSLYQRLITELGADLGTQRVEGVVSDPRGHRWVLALELIRQAPILGHGSGSEVPLLRDAYFTNGMYDSYLNRLNAHNQYLSLLIRHGIVGLLCWLGTLFFFARRALREKDILLGAFLVLILVTGLSENILDVNKGIFFYAFFLALLGSQRKKVRDSGGASNPGRVHIVRIGKENIPS